MSITPTTIRITKLYADDSGVEFAVGYFADYEGGEVHLEHNGQIATFPMAEVEWIIDALRYITHQVS